MWWWFALAFATDGDGFEAVKVKDDCAIESRARTHPDGGAMRAKCAWPEVDPAVLGRMMADLSRYEDYVFVLTESEVRKRVDERQLVYQRQEVFGLSDREVLLWAVVDRSSHGVQVSWTTANDEPLVIDKRSIRTPRNEGYWRIMARPEGGTTVVHEIGVDAGGRIPQWIVRIVRNQSFIRVMNDIRGLASEATARARTEAAQGSP